MSPVLHIMCFSTQLSVISMRPVAREQTNSGAVTQMKRAFKSCLLMRTFPQNAAGHRVPPLLPRHCLDSDSELTPKSAWHFHSSSKMNLRWSPINQVQQKGSNSQDRCADQQPGRSPIVNQIHGDYAGMMIPSFRGHYSRFMRLHRMALFLISLAPASGHAVR